MFSKFIYVKLIATGTVWDVGYRSTCKKAADKLGITGYAQNLSYTEVEVVAESKPDYVTEFLKQIRRDCVTALDIREVRLGGSREYKEFEMRADKF